MANRLIEIRVPLGTKLAEIDGMVIEQVLTMTSTKYEAAYLLGIWPTTLGARLKKYRQAAEARAAKVSDEITPREDASP